MRKFLFIVILAVSVCSTAHSDEPLKDHPLVKSNINLLDTWVKSQMAYKGIPGMSIAIVHDQDILYLRGLGDAEVSRGRKATPDTLYRIASHSKLFTAIGIMQLRDAGKLSLDDPIQKHLDWFKVKGVDPNSPPVTIRQLMTHSSGIPREGGSQAYWTSFDFPTREHVIEHLSEQEAVFPTETRWKYSNLAYALLGEVIRKVSGLPFAEYVETRIMVPLGMSNSGVTLDAIDESKLAVGYSRRLPDGSRSALPSIDARGMAAATGVTSSARDLARFVAWQFQLLDGKSNDVLKASTLREMQRLHWIDPTWTNGFGLTFMIHKYPDRVLVGHGGAYPGFRTATFVSPEEKLGVIVLANSLDAQPYPGDALSVVERAFDWVGGAIKQAREGRGVEQPQPHWEALTGTYRNIWKELHVMPLDGKLVVLSITDGNPKATSATLLPVNGSKTQYRVAEGPPIYDLGETVTFRLDENGQADFMRFGKLESPRVTNE